MNENQQIRCRCCGNITLMKVSHPSKHAERTSYVETQIPIRCPHCLQRMNPTEELFRAQFVG